MLDAHNLWELVEARAATSPDARMTVDEHGRSVTFGEYRNAAERAAAGLAGLGVEAGDVVSWVLPTWHESLVLVVALCRLGAVQNPIIPIYRDREVGFCTRQAGHDAAARARKWRGFDFEAMARAHRGRRPGALRGEVCDHAAPRRGPGWAAIPASEPRRPGPTSSSAGSSTRRARRPIRRAPVTPTATSSSPPGA